jgi:hypothetical protein
MNSSFKKRIGETKRALVNFILEFKISECRAERRKREKQFFCPSALLEKGEEEENSKRNQFPDYFFKKQSKATNEAAK